MRNKRGAGIATVLVVAALVLTLGFTLAASSVMHLNVSTRSVNAQHARELAESAVVEAIERVAAARGVYGRTDNPTYGQVIEVELEGLPPGSVGLLTFSPDQAAELGIPYSNNRFQIPNNVRIDPAWRNRVVPADCFHLMGTGRCNGVERTIEAVIHVPPYPFALASSGEIDSTNPILVGGLRDANQASTDGIAGTDPDDLLPGHLACNAGTEDSIFLSTGSLVTGNLMATGTTRLDPGARVRGEVRERIDPTALPDINIRSFDPGTTAPPLPASMTDAIVEGTRRATGLTVDGDLELRDGVLYVDGDLTIRNGGVIGKGFIVTTGKVTIDGGSSLDAGNHAAILAEDGIQLTGRGPASSAFQGVLYTQGAFSAEQISVLGALVVNGEDPESSTVTLTDTMVGHVPDYTKLKITTPGAFRKSYPNASSGFVQVRCFGTPQEGEPFEPRTFEVWAGPAYSWEVLRPAAPPGTPQSEYSRQIFSSEAAMHAYVADVMAWYEGYWREPPRSNNVVGDQIAADIPRVAQIFDASQAPDAWAEEYGSRTTAVAFDLSEFLSFEDRMKLRLWREL